MEIGIFDYSNDDTELRIYEIDSDCDRVLIKQDRDLSEVWGFIGKDNNARQVEGKLVKKVSPIVLVS